MKLTVTEWTKLQNQLLDLPETRERNRLWDKLEGRTFGKRYSDPVAIAISRDEQALLDQATAGAPADA